MKNLLGLSSSLLLWSVIVSISFGRTDALLFGLFGKFACMMSYRLNPFDMSDVDKFDTFFHDDSVFSLAQVGDYVGAKAIAEYVGFVYNTTSAYWAYGGERLATESRVIGYDRKEGMCVLESSMHSKYIFNETVAVSGQAFEVTSMVKIFLKPGGWFGLPGLFSGSAYYPRVNFYLPPNYIAYVFEDQLSGPKTRDYICNTVLNGPCSSVVTVPPDCDAQLAALPVTNDGRADGLSMACRVVHADFAYSNPENHCAHVLFEPTPDPNGKIKCQVASETSASDLFTEEDLEWFLEFQEMIGMDPEQGFVLVDE